MINRTDMVDFIADALSDFIDGFYLATGETFPSVDDLASVALKAATEFDPTLGKGDATDRVAIAHAIDDAEDYDTTHGARAAAALSVIMQRFGVHYTD